MAANAPSSHLLHILRSEPSSLPLISPSSPSFVSLLKPLLLSSTITAPTAIPKRLRQSRIPPRRESLPASKVGIAEDDEVIELYSEESGIKNEDEDTEMSRGSVSSPLDRNREERLKLPSLTAKEMKELASYAHSLGKKLKSQLVAKSGVTPNVATSFIETHELLKLLIP